MASTDGPQKCADPKCRHVWQRHIAKGFCSNVGCKCEGWTESWPPREA